MKVYRIERTDLRAGFPWSLLANGKHVFSYLTKRDAQAGMRHHFKRDTRPLHRSPSPLVLQRAPGFCSE